MNCSDVSPFALSRLAQRVSAGLVVEELHGWLWQDDVHLKHFDKAPDSGLERITVEHKGRLITGTLLTPDKGWAPGVLKVLSQSDSKTLHTTELGNKSEELRAGRFDQLHTMAIEKGRVETTMNDCGDLSMKRKFVPDKPINEDDEDACL